MAFQYEKRVLDAQLDALSLPAIIVEGAKAVGKTRTLERRTKTTYRLDDPRVLELIEADPQRMVSGEKPILIDECQRYVHTVDVVRRSVDDNYEPNQFFLAGSASRGGDTHTGGGRIASLRLRPMSFAERGLQDPTVSLTNLLEDRKAPIQGETGIGLEIYTEEILRSGFPGIRQLSGLNLETQLASYTDRIVQRDVADETGRVVRRPDTLRRWMQAYAAASSTVTSLERIRDAANGGSDQKPNQQTVLAYRDALEKLWIIDDVPPWIPSANHFGRLILTPKRQLVDPALAASLLGVTRDKLLSVEWVDPVVPRDGSFLGALFESLATLSVRVYAESIGATVRHLRQRDGRHEIDLIVERRDGAVLAIEVKLGTAPDGKDLAHLHWLKETIGSKLLDAICVCTAPYAYRRTDGIGVIPLALLGP